MNLHEYQKRTANFIHQHPNCIISVDMGLGKTASVLAWLNWYHNKFPDVTGLIVAPKRVAENNWKQEALKWGWTELANDMIICSGTKSKRDKAFNSPEKIKIISRDNINDVRGEYFDIIIIDELTSFKNPNASRSKSLATIRSYRRIGLTGTFLANGAIDVYGQAVACNLHESWREPNFYAWRASYFRDLLQGSGLAFSKWKLRGSLEDLLAPIAQNIFTLTADDYLTIPETIETTHSVDIGEEAMQAATDLDAFLSCELNGELIAFSEKQKFAKLQTICNGFVYDVDEDGCEVIRRGSSSPKLESVADFVADCNDAGEPVLLFYAFREEEQILCDLLKKRGIKTYSVRDNDFLQKWNDGEIDCLMAHPASAGHGLNLQHGGRIVVWSTLTYNFELFAQGNARLARQGQMRQTQLHYFVGKGTCEERAVAALIRKQQEQTDFLNLTKQ